MRAERQRKPSPGLTIQSIQKCTENGVIILAGSGNLDLQGVSEKAPAGEFTRCPCNPNSNNHNQHDGSPCFYLAIARSAVCASPVPHNSSLSCDLTRTRRSAQAAVSVQTHCSRYVDSLAGRTCVMFAKWTEARTPELHRLCPLFADRTQEDGKQTGRGQTHIPASHALTGQLLRLQWLMARPQPP
jgi:hypothetical protein